MQDKKFIFSLCLIAIFGTCLGLVISHRFEEKFFSFAMIGIGTFIAGSTMFHDSPKVQSMSMLQRFVVKNLSWAIPMALTLLFLALTAKFGLQRNWEVMLPFFIAKISFVFSFLFSILLSFPLF